MQSTTNCTVPEEVDCDDKTEIDRHREFFWGHRSGFLVKLDIRRFNKQYIKKGVIRGVAYHTDGDLLIMVDIDLKSEFAVLYKVKWIIHCHVYSQTDKIIWVLENEI